MKVLKVLLVAAMLVGAMPAVVSAQTTGKKTFTPEQQALRDARSGIEQAVKDCVAKLPHGERYKVDSVGPWADRQDATLTVRITVNHGMYARMKQLEVFEPFKPGTEDAAEVCAYIKAQPGITDILSP